jgi:hypothetical protein
MHTIQFTKMKYIIIDSLGLGSYPRAELLNRELYRISRPFPNPEDETKYLLSMYKNGDLGCLAFDDNSRIDVSDNMDVKDLKLLLSTDVSEEEKNALEQFLISKIGSFILFEQIVPSTITKYTKEQMQEMGWFPENAPV